MGADDRAKKGPIISRLEEAEKGVEQLLAAAAGAVRGEAARAAESPQDALRDAAEYSRQV